MEACFLLFVFCCALSVYYLCACVVFLFRCPKKEIQSCKAFQEALFSFRLPFSLLADKHVHTLACSDPCDDSV